MKIFRNLSACFLLITSCSVISHAGHGSSAPWKACEEKAVNQECSYTTHNKKALGTCQAMNDILMCVRNKPLETLLDKATQPTQSKPANAVKQSVTPLTNL